MTPPVRLGLANQAIASWILQGIWTWCRLKKFNPTIFFKLVPLGRKFQTWSCPIRRPKAQDMNQWPALITKICLSEMRPKRNFIGWGTLARGPAPRHEQPRATRQLMTASEMATTPPVRLGLANQAIASWILQGSQT